MTYRNNGPQDYRGMWEMLRGLRDDFAAARPRFIIDADIEDATPGDLRETLLTMLAEKSATGAALLRDIADQGADTWAPSAAEVYPTLQLLVDEGLATATEEEGRRTFTLTDAGRDEASAAAAEADSTDGGTHSWHGETDGPFAAFAQFAGVRGDLPKAGVKLGQAVRQVVVGADSQQVEKVTALLDETRRKIYAILAEDSPEPPTDDEQ